MGICVICKTFTDSDLGVHKECDLKMFGEAESHILTDVSLPGSYNKSLIETSKGSFILKPSTEDHPYISEGEITCNQIYQSMGVKVAAFSRYTHSEDMPFATKIFTQKSEIFEHLSNYLKNDKYTQKGIIDEYTIQSILGVLDMAGIKDDTNMFIRMCLADAIIGNDDRHSDNIGVLSKNGHRKLAPIYDNTSFIIRNKKVGNMDFCPYISISSDIIGSISGYIKAFYSYGYRDAVQKFFLKLDFEAIEDIINNSRVHTIRKQLLLKFIKKQISLATQTLTELEGANTCPSNCLKTTLTGEKK
jgi:hypothetical protein